MSQGAEVVANPPGRHDAFNKAEIAKWIKVAQAMGQQSPYEGRGVIDTS
jgi:hypothetical protein